MNNEYTRLKIGARTFASSMRHFNFWTYSELPKHYNICTALAKVIEENLITHVHVSGLGTGLDMYKLYY